MIRHSYSSIKEFEACSKKWAHKRVWKDVKDTPGEASIYGDRVHKGFEERLQLGVPLPEEIQKHEPLCTAIESLGGVVHAEKELVLTKEFAPTTWFAEDAWFRSKLDVLVLASKRAVIMDWKTGKRRPDFLQLELSAAQVFIHYPEVDTINTAFIWIKENTTDKEVYKRSSLEAIKELLINKTNKIEEAVELGVFPAKPSGLCSYCPAFEKCEFAQRGRYRRR